jgi:hypothetical protein
MKFAFCIGNGESRKGFNIDDLKAHGTVYGTNAIFRDTTVDHLICCDRRMAMETVSAGYTGPVYTREDWYSFFPYDNFHKLAPLPWQEKEKHTQSFHIGSGLHAVNLALYNGADIVVLIGHDFWASGSKHNNIYKGTENYADTIAPAVDPSFWIKQFVMFFNTYPDTQFVFCQPNIKSWKRPPGWDTETFPNIQFEELESLLDALNQS